MKSARYYLLRAVRTRTDAADSLLQEAELQAREAGDDSLERAVGSARKELAEVARRSKVAWEDCALREAKQLEIT